MSWFLAGIVGLIAGIVRLTLRSRVTTVRGFLMAPAPSRDRRAIALLAAAGHEMNDDLTILYSAVCDVSALTERDDPRFALLMEATAAIDSLSQMARAMLKYANEKGVNATRISVEKIANSCE